MLKKLAMALVAGAMLASGVIVAPTEASAADHRCWRCRTSGWAGRHYYVYRNYLWPAPYYAGASRRRFYANYVRWGWPPPYVGGYLAEIRPVRAYGW